MLTYAEARTRMSSARKDVVVLERNTRLHEVRVNAGPQGIAYAVQFHETDVVTIMAGNRYALRTGGWSSPSTVDRIFNWSPVTWRTLYTKLKRDGGWDRDADQWYPPSDTTDEWQLSVRPNPRDPEPEVSHNSAAWRAWRDRQWIPFFEGIVVDADGYPLKLHVDSYFKAKREADRDARRVERAHAERLRHERQLERFKARVIKARARREGEFEATAHRLANTLAQINFNLRSEDVHVG